MKFYDWVILGIYVIAMAVLVFFMKCSLDIYFVILGAAIAIMCAVAFVIAKKKVNEKKSAE